MNKFNKGISTLTGILIIIAVAVVAFGGVFAYEYFTGKTQPVIQTQQSQNTNQIQNATTQAPINQTAGWQTYTNTQYGFSLQYPNTFQVKQDTNGTYLYQYNAPIDSNHTAHIITIYISAGPNLTAPLLGTCGSSCPYPSSAIAFSQKNGNWKEDYIFAYGGMGSWDSVINAYQQNSGNYYMLSLYSGLALGEPGMNGPNNPSEAQIIAPELKSLQDPNNPDVLILDNLVKIKKTEPQMKLSAKDRTENLKNAFLVKNPEGISGKKIFLIDDVYTTGSTMEECARILRDAGAKSVWGMVIAREG